MGVERIPRTLLIRDDSLPIKVWRQKNGKIAFSHAFFGMQIDPEDLRTVLDELAPAVTPKEESKDD